MEVGKLKSSSASPIFYFILDPLCPDEPNPARLQHFFVISHLDSYVEAFNFICKSICVPATETALRRWHNVYSKVFGAVTFDSFCRAVQTLPTKHFHLEANEAAARAYASALSSNAEARRLSPHRPRPGPAIVPETNAPGSVLTSRDTNLLLNPQRDGEDPVLQLHRIRAELQEVQGQLRMEQSRTKVNGLGDAERTALLYKLESAQKELESEKVRSKEHSEKQRAQIKMLQERLDKLLEQHDDNLENLAASERQHIAGMEETFLRRETEMKEEFELAMRDRDKKLAKATSRAESAEQQLAQAMREVESLRDENTRLSTSLLQLNAEREAEESQFKRLRLQHEAHETHRMSLERDLARWEEEMRRAEAENTRLRAEAARWHREATRLHHFTSSLQHELKDLDAESATTAEVLRKRVLRERGY